VTVRVLHIDDDARFAELVATYLSQNGMAVTHTLDGGRGLAALESGSFDAVLLDVMMPGMDGLEVCRESSWPACAPCSAARSPTPSRRSSRWVTSPWT
jgi:DNA-binding response OmpR family regulator